MDRLITEKAEKYLSDFITETTNYYIDEMNKLLPIDEFGVQIQLSSTNGRTKWLSLNEEAWNALQKFIEEVKKSDNYKGYPLK